MNGNKFNDIKRKLDDVVERIHFIQNIIDLKNYRGVESELQHLIKYIQDIKMEIKE